MAIEVLTKSGSMFNCPSSFLTLFDIYFWSVDCWLDTKP